MYSPASSSMGSSHQPHNPERGKEQADDEEEGSGGDCGDGCSNKDDCDDDQQQRRPLPPSCCAAAAVSASSSPSVQRVAVPTTTATATIRRRRWFRWLAPDGAAAGDEEGSERGGQDEEGSVKRVSVGVGGGGGGGGPPRTRRVPRTLAVVPTSWSYSSFSFFNWPMPSSSNDSLRSQLLRGFGLAAFVSLGLVVLLAIVAAYVSANIVNGPAVNQLMREQVNRTLGLSSCMVAETFDAYMMDLEGTLQILVEAVQDRIVGYPDQPGWETDRYVPFQDMEPTNESQQSSRRVYPLNVSPPPLDWAHRHNLNSTNAYEHIQERIHVVAPLYINHSSTVSATYFVQGSCNPNVTDPTADSYLPNCTAANNNMTTGGVIYPTSTNYPLWQKSGDLGVFLKPLFEAQGDALFVMIAFFNDGAGSLLTFPGSPISGSWDPYVSNGCEWMSTTNPHTGMPFGTDEMIQRCRPKGTKVPYRLYNPMEQEWCQTLALSIDPDHQLNHGGKIQWFGPLRVNGVNDPVMLVGKSVFDQMTGSFIGCTAVVIELSTLSKHLQASKLKNTSRLALVRYESGIVINDSSNTVVTTGNASLHVADTGVVGNQSFTRFQNAVNFSAPWTQDSLMDAYESLLIECVSGPTIAIPLPIPPQEYDPSYRPTFFLIDAMGPNAFDVTENMNRQIQHDVLRIVATTLCLGIFGFLLLLLIIWCVARMLTQPLLWMDETAGRIVDNDTQRADLQMVMNAPPGSASGSGSDEEASAASTSPSSSSAAAAATLYCAPKSEVDELVHEFRIMIQNFSGSGPATVAETPLQEIRNDLTWHSEFSNLYPQRPKPKAVASSTSVPATATAMNPPPSPVMAPQPSFRSLAMAPGRSVPLVDGAAVETATKANGYSSGTRISEDEEAPSKGSPSPLRSSSDASPTSQDHFDVSLAKLEFLETDDAGNAPERLEQLGRDAVERNGGDPLPIEVPPPIPPPQELAESTSSQLIVPAPSKQNCAHVFNVSAADSSKKTWEHCVEGQPIKYHRSRLFWLIVVLMVIPLLLTNAVICAIVSNEIVTTIPRWVEQAGNASFELEIDALKVTASSKATLVNALVFESIRDVHLITRIAGWLAFGGVNRSDSITAMSTFSEECRVYEMGTCPVLKNTTLTPCVCEWHDLFSKTCQNSTSPMEARYLQQLFYSAEARDANPMTGFRNASPSFPEFGSSPNATEYWDSLEQLPGSWKGDNSSGYGTSYDRVRLASAASIAEFPVYNYRIHLKRVPLRTVMGVYVAFQDDGMMTGVSNCGYDVANQAFFESSPSNGAYLVNPDLCPEGKYGYDPRCRDWYATGKREYDQSQVPVLITAPYIFALQNTLATSATSPIANPEAGEYVGQVLLDHVQSSIITAVTEVNPNQQSILVTPDGHADAAGGTIVQACLNGTWTASNITDCIFTMDPPGSPNRVEFEKNVLPRMKATFSGVETALIKRTMNDTTEQVLLVAFAAITQRALLPVNPSNFSRGANASEFHFYTIGIAVDINATHAEFQNVQSGIEGELSTLNSIYIALTVFVSVLFFAVACMITITVTRPMIILLRAVQNINQRTIDGDLPPFVEGSREVHRVYNTFAKLYRVVRISNSAFFSHKFKASYRIISNALELFRKVDDRKAVGVACNNLGNTLFALYYDSREEALDGWCGCHSCVSCVAMPHYNEAVDIAQSDFDTADDDMNLKAEYAVQLSDRLFSRGLFKLLTCNDPCSAPDARSTGYADIERARFLDYDVRDFWIEHKLLLKNSGPYFARLLRRICGLSEFWDDVGLRTVWDVNELVEGADQLLFAAWSVPDAPLFREVTRVGRLQQLEAAAIQLLHRKGNDLEAARLAMRMLSEDAYLLEGPFVRAAEALLRLMVRDSDSSYLLMSKSTITSTRHDIRQMLKCCKNVTMDIGKNVVFSFEISEQWEGDPLLDKIQENCLRLYDRHCHPHDNVGVVAYTTKRGRLVSDLSMKRFNEGRQRSYLELATSGTSERANPAFPLAIQMVLDSHASLDSDSFVILFVDGYAWDSDAAASIQAQLERLHRDRGSASIHLFIIGLDLEDECIREQCRSLCSIHRAGSLFSEGAVDNLDLIFDHVSATIAGRPVSAGYQIGVTMEKF